MALACTQSRTATVTWRVLRTSAIDCARCAKTEAKIRAEDSKLLLTTQLSEVEDVDVVEALITAKAQENSYQASLQVAAKILPPSLLDYLR